MPNPTRFDPALSYTLTGKTLNEIFERLDTNRLLNGPGYQVSSNPGFGTRLRISASEIRRLWDLSVVDIDAATIKLLRPGRVKRTTALDDSGLCTIEDVDDNFTAVADSLFVLEVTPDPVDGLLVKLRMIPEWDGWPYPMDTEETDPAGFWVMTKYYYVLYDIRAVTVDTDYNDPDVVPINADLVAERRHHGTHLQFELTRQEDKDGHVISAFQLFPSLSCRRA